VDSETEKDGHQDMALTPRTEASTPESGGEYTTYICDSDRRSNSEKSSEDETYGERTLQRHMSQTDDHIQLLDRNGDLNEVAGSQSMLSQELIDHDHDETRDLGLPRGSSSKTSIGIAKRIGLLSNSQEELPSSQETTHSQEPLSGLDLLTHVGIKEAHKIPSFSTETKPSTDSSSNKATSFSANPTKPREHEGFGSLLDAVAKITEQEASQEYSMDWRTASTTTAFNTTKTKTTIPKRIGQKRKIARMLPTSKRLGPAAKQRKSEGQKTKERLRRERIEQEKEKAQATANRAAMIAERTISDPAIAKKLLLSMALARENPRSVPQTLRGKGHVVQEGFFWAHYPPLEIVLKNHMAEYYELSTNQCQSRQQQAFNNYMVGVVKDVAEKQQWAFADSFCDKSLRDRIRCYYKTHIQNAKKRLRTMVRNPTKRANARHLCEHVDLIEQHQVKATPKDSSKSTDRVKTEK